MSKVKMISMVFDATIIEQEKGKNCGICRAALNLLRRFVGRGLCTHIYVDRPQANFVNRLLQKEFPGQKFTIITNFVNSKRDLYARLKAAKRTAHDRRERLTELLILPLLLFVRILAALESGWRKLWLQSIVKSCNVFFSPLTYPANAKLFSKLKKFIMLHDIIPLKLSWYAAACDESGWFGRLLKRLNNHDHYFANSEYTKQDFLDSCAMLQADQIVCTHLACEDGFAPKTGAEIEVARQKYHIPIGKKYIFSLCTIEPRKNLIRAVKTFIAFTKKHCIQDLVFVLGGAHWDTFIKTFQQETGILDACNGLIIQAGYVADEDLPALYSGAEWFVYTSQYEGFGLPPLEAMSCGCPVITSNNTSLPEVVGDAGIMIDWDSDEQHIAAYEEYYFNPAMRQEFSRKGLARSRQFSWEKCADIMINKMAEVVSGGK